MTNGLGTRNDIAWEQLFEKFQILETIEREGQFYISAKSINEFREARLMTKFDDIEHLPSLFRNNGLAVLPVSRGDYLIADLAAYERLELRYNNPVIYRRFPEYIHSLDYENITSEAAAINCAYVSGILGHFLDDDELHPTVSGRMSSGQFQFSIERSKNSHAQLEINVRNAQIEIDGGYEGTHSLSLIEAKNAIPYTFLVRQLYYPYRLWSARIVKSVRPIFLTYTNRIFHLYEYKFVDPTHYNSLSLIREQRYTLDPIDISLDDLVALLAMVVEVEEPAQPFPQADSFERVVNLCELLHEAPQGSLLQEEITVIYSFVGRQTHYYTAAGCYLGLIEKSKADAITYSLSKQGRALFKLGYRDRQLGFAAAILAHRVFAMSFQRYLSKNVLPTIDEIVAVMQNAGLRNINTESTYYRRARTVRGWLGWIVGLLSREE